jgi:magnesium chelatase family protein
MNIIKSATLDAFDAICVDVEASFTKGLPSFSIVGLASSSIQESRDRVKSALLMNDYKFPPKKITINLSPSDITKNGTHFDLCIALLIALESEKKVDFNDFFIFAELGLDGLLKENLSIFALVLSLAKNNPFMKVLVPKSIAQKISLIPDIQIYCVDTLSQAIDFFKFDNKELSRISNESLSCKKISGGKRDYFYNSSYPLNFLDVKGQTHAKRAALIAVSGNHNILFEGSPGCGKSMIIKRLQYIMPPQTAQQILEKAKLDSLNGVEPKFDASRVFRSPHHSSTKASIFGGGTVNSKIGEVALANNGVLFFDELPHFPKSILEAMREPLEDYTLLISRVNSKIQYQTKFLFASAQNPCPCGNSLSSTKECRCSDLEVSRYKSCLSDPFLDRIDMFVTMNDVNYSDKSDVDSSHLHQKVIAAFIVQMKRGQEELNGKLSDEEVQVQCSLNSECELILSQATQSFSLSFRSINKVLKVSRTIADIEGSKSIEKAHILEALSYRKR